MPLSIPFRSHERPAHADGEAFSSAAAGADSSGFRGDIEGLRGFALVIVLLTHADVSFLSGGYIALDIFFVLSGYLITGLMLSEAAKTGRVSLLRFYARRARRILPLSATVLGVILLVSLFTLDPVRAASVSNDAVAAAAYFVNWHFISQSIDYFNFNDPNVSPIQHYWSLSVEEQYYIVWPILVVGALMLARRFGVRLRPLLWGLLLVIGGASLGYSIWYTPLNPNAAYLSTFPRVWQVGAGCALALAMPSVIRLPKLVAAALGAGGIGAILWASMAYAAGAPYPGWRSIVPTLGTVAIIVAGTATARTLPTRFLMLSPVRYLGRLSYAWYLWHWPFLVFAAAFFGSLTVGEKILVVGIAGIPAVVSHYVVEERFRRSPLLGRRPRLAIAVGAACTAAAVAAGLGEAGTRATIAVAARDQVPGAHVILAGDTKIENSIDRVRPTPQDAWKDRGVAFAHCELDEWSPPVSPGGNVCVFGDRSSKTTVVNIGDSHGLMYSPGLISLALKRHWRLVNLTRAGCTVADVHYVPLCDAWRKNMLARVAQEHPSLVVVSTGTQTVYEPQRYAVIHNGKRLTRAQSEPYLVAGLTRTLRRLRQTGAKVVVIRDIAADPEGINGCVAAHSHHLVTCAFVPHRPQALAFDKRAAQRVPGVKLIDPLPIICPNRLCPAVIGHALVYRNDYHLTATFAQTLDDWFAKELPRLKHAGA
jgi:peptidoglycan/LPS O-acetylase OafA/YrhL